MANQLQQITCEAFKKYRLSCLSLNQHLQEWRQETYLESSPLTRAQAVLTCCWLWEPPCPGSLLKGGHTWHFPFTLWTQEPLFLKISWTKDLWNTFWVVFLGNLSITCVSLLTRKKREMCSLSWNPQKPSFPQNFIEGTSHLLPLAILTQMIGDGECVGS